MIKLKKYIATNFQWKKSNKINIFINLMIYEICGELTERISKEKISIIEDTNSIVISILLPSSKIKEIVFELKENEKSDKEIIKDLINLVHEQKEQINNIQNEFNNFKKEISFL